MSQHRNLWGSLSLSLSLNVCVCVCVYVYAHAFYSGEIRLNLSFLILAAYEPPPLQSSTGFEPTIWLPVCILQHQVYVCRVKLLGTRSSCKITTNIEAHNY